MVEGGCLSAREELGALFKTGSNYGRCGGGVCVRVLPLFMSNALREVGCDFMGFISGCCIVCVRVRVCSGKRGGGKMSNFILCVISVWGRSPDKSLAKAFICPFLARSH